MNQEKSLGWDREKLKDPHALQDKRQRVQAMFSGIADSYDLLNHVLSFNLDRRWRRRAVELAEVGPGQAVLDICCGTGDLALAFAQARLDLGELVGADFSEPMLQKAATKSAACGSPTRFARHKTIVPKWLCADAERLPMLDQRFDCVSCAFGIRNLQNLDEGLREAFRVLKPGGRLVILEFALPRNRLIAWMYGCYFRLVLPVIGGIIASDRHGAYRYLPESVRSFATVQELTELMRKTGFCAVQSESLSWGAVTALVARKP